MQRYDLHRLGLAEDYILLLCRIGVAKLVKTATDVEKYGSVFLKLLAKPYPQNKVIGGD